MAAAYAYTPAIWPPLAAALFLAVIGPYCWRRRDVPGALPLSAVTLFGTLWLLGIALEAVSVAPGTKIAWFRFQALWRSPTVTAGLCFVWEYAYPGRWLTRRNLVLLSLPAVLDILLVFINDGQPVWRRLEIGPDGSVVAYLAPWGVLLTAYGVGLVLVNSATLLWLFIRSPQHRWPVALILVAQIASRGLYVADAAQLPWSAPFDRLVLALFLPYAMYAIALFGFRIFDPLPLARRAVIEQMQAGIVVFDPQWRVLSLNPVAETILGIRESAARGKTWDRLVLPGRFWPDLLPGSARRASGPAVLPEITLGSGEDVRHYAPVVSPLEDFRGLLMGRLLMLRDVTAEKRAHAQIVEQQRSLAVLEERERLACELHDSLGQVLAAGHMQAKSARRWLNQGQQALADETLALLEETTLEVQADVRDYLLGAKTVISANRPFFPTLREYVRRFSRQYGLPVELAVPVELETQGLSEATEVQLYRIIQEALSNVRKHAGASCAQVIFSQAGPAVHIAIVDDGGGFDPGAIDIAGQSYGLQAMRDRAKAISGRLTVVSSPGAGTQVVLQIPRVTLGSRIDENSSG